MLKPVIIIVFIIITLSIRCDCGDNDKALRIFPNLPPGISSNNTICDNHNRIYRENLDNFTLWAHEMWDATAKATTGIFRGNMYAMGYFEECLNVEAPFVTQYCLVTFQAVVPTINRTDPFSLYHNPNENIIERLYFYDHRTLYRRNMVKIGWCVPASCAPEDLQHFLDDYVQHLDMPLAKQNHINFTVNVTDWECQTLDERNFDTLDIAFCVLTGALLLLVSLATIVEGNQTKTIDGNSAKPALSKRLLLSFALQSNLRSFLKVEYPNSPLNILYGVRIISIFMIIVAHRSATISNIAVLNLDEVENAYRQIYTSILQRTDLFVDSFFMMSGLLISHNLFKQFDKKSLNPVLIVFLRYIRLTPILAYVVFFQATLLNHTGSGPLWKTIITTERDDCRTNWWTNLLYLNNFINVEHLCMIHGWYLACDFQFFLLALLIFLLIYKYRKFGLIALFSLMLMSIITQFLVTFIYEKSGVFLTDRVFMENMKGNDDYHLSYTKPHTRAGTYLIGFLTGYVYYRTQHIDLRINKIKSYIILTLSIIVMLVAILYASVFYNPYHAYNKLEAAIFAALNRPAWVVGSIGIFYVAIYGHARLIYRILSWKPWIILGKLVYGVYLVHLPYNMGRVGDVVSSQLVTYKSAIIAVLSNTIVAYTVAFLLHLIIELPVKRMSNELLLRPNKSAQNQETNCKSNNNECCVSKL